MPVSSGNPIRADLVSIIIDKNTGRITYSYTLNGHKITLNENEIFHVKGISFDGLTGLSPITAARHSFGTAMAAEEAAGKTFQNGLFSPTYIKTNEYLTQEQQKKAAAILQDFSSATNAGRTPILQGGWSVETIGLKPEDSQLLETRRFSIETICRWFGIQPVMIGHMEKSTAWGSGLEQMNLWFLQYSLTPWLVRIEQSISRCLLSAPERDIYFARHNVDSLLWGDSQSRAQFYIVGRQNGYLTANEVRQKENLPPLSGGDNLTVQAQMVPLQGISEQGDKTSA